MPWNTPVQVPAWLALLGVCALIVGAVDALSKLF